MFVTYLTCIGQRGRMIGLFGFNVDWDRPRRPSECIWLVPGTWED